MLNKNWFTLIEIMIWILISSMIIVIWFNAFNAILVWKIKLIESTNIEKESFKFSQKFFEEIKAWGIIDYEEYFNRKVVWNTSYSSGHFDKPTWFWNFWELWNPDNTSSTDYWQWFYYCISDNWTQMTWSWCVNNFNTRSFDQDWEPQRYGQYSFQFIDYNSNYDDDEYSGATLLWDEDWDWDIIWDDDDEYLGEGPEAFDSSEWITELYLISADKTKRTLFRWTVINDPDYKDNISCNTSDWKTFTWSWCLGTIEFLRLEWKDWWENHDKLPWIWLYDWVIDTWLIDKDFAWWSTIVAWSDNTEQYWQALFPNSINVSEFDIRAYPNKDIKHAWKESWIDISPYIRIQMTLSPSWKTKKAIKWKVPEFNISTTVNLTEIFSR